MYIYTHFFSSLSEKVFLHPNKRNDPPAPKTLRRPEVALVNQ